MASKASPRRRGKLIEEAELVLGAEATLKLLPKSGVTDKRIALGGNLDEAVAARHQGGR